MGLKGVSSNIRSLLGVSSDIHTLLGTSSLKKKEYKPDMVYDDGTGIEEDDDYTPDYVGDDGPWGYAKPSEAQIKENKDEIKDIVWADWFLMFNSENPNMTTYKKFKIISVEPKQRIRIIQHPIEDGTVRMDNRVRDPLILTVKGYVKQTDVSDVNALLQKAVDAKEKYMFQNTMDLYSPLGSGYKNLWLIDYTKRASTDKIDTFEYSLELQEVLVDQSQTDFVDNATYSSTTSKGGQGN